MDDTLKNLSADPDGMMTYDYIVNSVENGETDLDFPVENLLSVDKSGQFLASSARYLNAVDKNAFKEYINRLVEGAIDCDRERKYISSLLEALWGKDYHERAGELSMTVNNFRRIYKRVYPEHDVM